MSANSGWNCFGLNTTDYRVEYDPVRDYIIINDVCVVLSLLYITLIMIALVFFIFKMHET